MTDDRRLTVDALRDVVQRLIDRGELVNPQRVTPGDRLLVLDIDDHLSDEAIAGGRVRVVLRSARELAAIARALELEADR